MAVILVVDDERKIRQLVCTYLERAGYTTLQAGTGGEAVKLAGTVDLIILDLGLPDRAGLDVTRDIRRSLHVPIIMLTARAGEADRIAGLRLGADDYVTKPFSPAELVARVAAVLRRTSVDGGGVAAGPVSFAAGVLRIDVERREVMVHERLVGLTRSEFDLLTTLAARPGRVYSRSELASIVHGDHAHDRAERGIDVHVKNLRRKLGDSPAAARLVCTVTGVGYKLAVDRDG